MAKDTGTVNIHGKEYKTVAARVQAFREEHGDRFGIVTEIVSADDKVVVMKASVIEGRWLQPALFETVVLATGHAEEVRTSSQINRTSALENAETSAIGRALAAFGMAGTEYASADEVAQAIHQQKQPAPSEPEKGADTADDANTLARAKVVINDTLEDQGYTAEVAKKAFITKVLKQSKIDNLDQANEVMDALENEQPDTEVE
jgi:hypothetical protein